MFHVLLIILILINFCISNDPILIASPYPFNTSKTSHIECFSNDQGILLSLTITAAMLDIDKHIPSLQYTKDNIIKNESIILTIPSPFNYSQLQSNIECRSKYHHGQQKTSQLQVLSVADITQKEFLSMNANAKQMVTINCLTYGTNVFIHWDFSKDISKNAFGHLPIGIRIDHRFIPNDTLIIDHVSYSDHYGYYRCYAKNKLIGMTYEDKSIIYLKVKKKIIWIPIAIVCIVIGLCILMLILCSRYCQKKRKNQLDVKQIPQEAEQIMSNKESSEFSPDYNKQKQDNLHTRSHSENSIKSQISFLHPLSISKNSPQFVLGNPFLDSNVQPFISVKSYIDKLK